jgi:hypothetical protein
MTEEEFTGFARKHYRVTSGVAFDACTAFKERQQEVVAAHQDYAAAVGGVGCYTGNTENVGNATAISAVIFEGELPSGWKRRSWKSFSGMKPGQIAGWPDKRTASGKAALADIAALPLAPTPDRICAPIGFPTCLKYERPDGGSCMQHMGLWNVANIGWLEGVFYLSLPDYAAQKAAKEREGYTVTLPAWDVPEGMVMVLKEEVALDYARARAAEALAA